MKMVEVDHSNLGRSHIDKVKFKCDNCEVKFSTKKNLERHIKSIHQGLKFSCHICNYEATTTKNWSLHTHIKVMHKAITEAQFKCEYCEVEFSIKNSLRVHTESVHFDAAFPCQNCDYVTANECTLRNHMKTKHEEMPFQHDCPLCPHQAPTELSLKRHTTKKHLMLTMSYPYPCSLCERKFSKKNNQNSHFESVHATVKTYSFCSYCAFKTYKTPS